MEDRRLKFALIAITLFAAVVLAISQFNYNLKKDNLENRGPASTGAAPELE